MNIMNWHLVGVKVRAATLLTIALIATGLLITFHFTEKQQVLENAIADAKNNLAISEAIQEGVLERWAKGIYSVDLLKNMAQLSRERAKPSIMATVPIANISETLSLAAKSQNFRFKAARIGARNPLNEADEFDRQALQFFKATPDRKDYYLMDNAKEELRVYRAVRLSAQCEICHGASSQSQVLWDNAEGRDVLGYRMENQRTGDLHAALTFIIPLEPLYDVLDKQTMQALLFMLFSLLLLAVVSHYAMNHFIIDPLTDLALKLESIAGNECNLTARLEVTGESEFAWIASSFNRFVKKIANTVIEINSSSEKLAVASERLSSITRNAEAGVNQQQAETTHVVTAMEQMTASVHEVARNTAEASSAASAADSDAISSKQVIQEAVQGIHVLASEVESAVNVIKALESDSTSIGSILSTIQGIAEQTNLLALNAAIEAARAGEQGRGFAVVADEVRTLASRTQNATFEIQKTIERLQARAQQASKTMEKGKRQATTSVEQAASSGVAMDNISFKIDHINDMNNQIASAVEEQSAVAKEISRNIHNINQVTQATSNGVRKSAQACRELLELSNQLKISMAQFKI